ncbi:glycerate kinase [Arthrobacter globiformis NBRC 12137]|uniref:Glycerate kinase n=1 Tax=Arthrobacter globiformis (strain ATCC 8010 / DSM 20124 / JCM 1332 / NBRC 12137 / NCIMB 8907 / NRRL B-2979 / 168) TaxID=1077972 RepID=H0QJG4_ARTG1|nr:glycerate kinase [Arthrobacter globiformis]GAB12965.1 glycerate kinase [Arthrobacter globiformis NBRC 12137]
MRILIAPDKFKGSLTAVEAAAAIAEGALRVYPDAVTTQFPIADGGEGTLESAVAAGYEERINAVVGPILAPIGAAWALRKDKSGATTAVIETAQASGLAHMEPTPENSLRAHSYGCGQLIAAALDAGATEIVLGVGGSAMTDAGSGALRALGLKPLDAAGNVVPLGGGSLADVVSLDVSGLDPRLSAVQFRIACDVQSPLYGTTGAAHVFGRQKGADDDAIEKLDAGLRNWASLLREATGRDVNVPGAGAAGGFPASFLAFAQATLEGGFALVAALTGLAGKLADADLVITGEGSMDSQSLTGKAPIALAEAARERGIPVVAVAGRILVTPEELAEHGVVAAAQLLDVAPSPQDAISDAGKYLAWATRQVLEGA